MLLRSMTKNSTRAELSSCSTCPAVITAGILVSISLLAAVGLTILMVCPSRGVRWHVFYRNFTHMAQVGAQCTGVMFLLLICSTWQRRTYCLSPQSLEEEDGAFSGSAVIGDDGETNYYTGHRWANGADNTGGDWQVQMLHNQMMMD